jgi:lambda family phage tail tape measure protein
MATNEKFILDFAVRGVDGIERAGDKIDRLESRVRGLSTALLGVGFGAFLKGALDAADRIVDLSEATNISTASLDNMAKAMDAAGGKSKNLEKVINGFYASINDANNGSLKARDAFAAVGVSLNDLKNKSEAQILDQVLKGLARLPEGAEKARIQTELLTRGFNGVNASKFIEALEKGREAAEQNAKSIEEGAESAEKLRKAYETLQTGAIKALEPIARLFGETELSVKTATTLVQGLGVAFGVIIGTKAVAGVVGMIVAIGKLNTALGITAGIANLLGKSPLGVLLKLGAAVAGGAALTSELADLIKKNEELERSAGAAANAQQQVFGAGAGRGTVGMPQAQPGEGVAVATGQGVQGTTTVAPGGPLITQRTPTGGSAGRNQELDARQKAEIESNRRIADAKAEYEKLVAVVTASDIQKINLEFAQKSSQIEADVRSKEYLSAAQRQLEIDARVASARADRDAKIAEIKKQQERELASITAGYQDQINSMLGIEKSELQKINELIAQQPERYAEVVDRLREIARGQDLAIANTRKLRLEQELVNNAYETGRSLVGVILEGNKAALQRVASTQLERDLIEEQFRLSEQIESSRKSIVGYQEAMIAYQTEESDRTAQQIRQIEEYEARLKSVTTTLNIQSQQRQENIRRDYEESRNFNVGWKNAMDKYVEDSRNAAEQARNIFSTVTRGMEDLIVNFVRTGKLSLKDFANSIIETFVRIQAQRLIGGLFGGATGAGGIFSALIGPPGRALGGPVSANSPYMVGERGPELFVPRSAGNIIPNNQLGASTPITNNVVYNIQAVDALSFRQMVARDPEFIYAVTEKGRSSVPSRR